MKREEPTPNGAGSSGESNGSRQPEATRTNAPDQAGFSIDQTSDGPLPVDDATVRAGAGEGIMPFPIELLPPVMRAMVEETARQTRTPHALSAVVALGTAAAVVGRGLLVKSAGSRTTPANLFLLAIARSGVGKGQTFGHITGSLYAAQKEAVANWKKEQMPHIEASFDVTRERAKKEKQRAVSAKDEESRKAIIAAIAALEEEQKRLEELKNSPPCYVVGDITREALALTLASQPNEALACFSSEARGILDVIRGRYGKGESSDEDIYLSAYSGDPISVRRVGRPPVTLEHPCLSVVWMTQPDAAQRLLGDERMTASGLLPRFLMCDVRAEHQYEPEHWDEMDASVVHAWDGLVQSLLAYRNTCGEPIRIDAEDAVRRMIRKFHNHAVDRMRVGGDLRDVDSYVSRWTENVWRLSLVLHCATHGADAHRVPLREENAARAIGILEWFVREQLAILAAGRTDQFKARLDKLLGILRDGGGWKTLGQLKDANGFEADEVHSLADRFPQQLAVEKRDQRGRPSFIARLATAPGPTPINPTNPSNDT
jgi:hypothetical protein